MLNPTRNKITCNYKRSGVWRYLTIVQNFWPVIMELGLNEFCLDLLDYIKNNGDLDKTPLGLHAVVQTEDDTPPGVIFVLKTLMAVSTSTNKTGSTRMYIANNSEEVCNHLFLKYLLGVFRSRSFMRTCLLVRSINGFLWNRLTSFAGGTRCFPVPLILPPETLFQRLKL